MSVNSSGEVGPEVQEKQKHFPSNKRHFPFPSSGQSQVEVAGRLKTAVLPLITFVEGKRKGEAQDSQFAPMSHSLASHGKAETHQTAQ